MNISLDIIKDILIKNMPDNKSGGEVVLSVGESLLLVIDACKKANVDKAVMDELNQLYLEGTKTEADRTFVSGVKAILADKNFTVKSDPKTINEDPSRRYFETNLAHNILQNNAASLKHGELAAFTRNLTKRLFSLPATDPRVAADLAALKEKVPMILAGELYDKAQPTKTNRRLNKYELEYAEVIHKLMHNKFPGLTPKGKDSSGKEIDPDGDARKRKACKNLLEIARCSILATLNTQFDKSMPANIYDDSIFTMGMDGRGRSVKGSHDEVRTTAKGIMKSSTPLPMYDDLVNAASDGYVLTGQNDDPHSPFQRSADQATFMLESQWSQHLFSRQTQVYSNGISSTTLAQLRNIILQKRLGNQHFKDGPKNPANFQNYMTSFAALMLYNSGGHSLFEIFEVFKLPLCRELTHTNPKTKEALAEDRLMYEWLCKDQPTAFNDALDATQEYMRTLITKRMVHAELNKKHPTVDPDLANAPSQPELHQAVISSSPEEFAKLMLTVTKRDIENRNNAGWTPLMVAAQLGRTEHVKMLLDAGADLKPIVTVAGLALGALELAIKSQKYDTVQVLLKHAAAAKINAVDKINAMVDLKKRCPALYLACRQNDKNILKSVLAAAGTQINIEDKKLAILTAVQVENLDAVEEIISGISEKDKKAHFSEKYKSQLLTEAVNLGNIQLLQGIMALKIHPAAEQINYYELIHTAAKKGYLPAAKHLLDLFNDQDVQGKPEINLDMSLTTALQNGHYDMAVLLIIYGANPKSLFNTSSYLQKFDAYLQETQYFDFLFNVDDQAIIAARAAEISQALTERTSGFKNSFLKHLVDFLNFLLPAFLRIGYNDKTNVIASLSTVFDSKSGGIDNADEPIEPLSYSQGLVIPPKEPTVSVLKAVEPGEQPAAKKPSALAKLSIFGSSVPPKATEIIAEPSVPEAGKKGF